MMKKFLNEFKTFAIKGNIFSLATGVVIGGASNKLVSSLVNNILMPIISFLTGGINFAEYKLTLVEATQNTSAVTLNIGLFIQDAVDFLIISLSIFIAVKIVNKLDARMNLHKEKAENTVPENIILLRDIRDLIKKQSNLENT